MKISAFFAAAGIAVAALGMSVPAEARPGDRAERGWHDNGRHRGWDRHDRRDRRWDRHDRRGDRRYYGRNSRRCWTEYRHHRRIRVCR